MAAQAGAQVLVLERERFPRDKVCGEFLSAEGCSVLARVGIEERIRERGVCSIDSFRITDRRGRAIDAKLPVPALGVSRSLLDTLLLDLARRSGAEVRERWETVAPVVEEGWVTGARIRPVGSGVYGEIVRPSVVVAADGRRSPIARALHLRLCDPTRTGPRSWFGLKVHLAGDPARIEGRVDLHLFDGGYAGLAAVEGGQINLCLLARVAALRECRGSPDELLHERILGNPAARAVLEGATVNGPWQSIGPLRFGARRAASKGVLFVGDAAGTIDPFSGEGMSNALRGAEIALPFVLEAASRGALDPDLARDYRREWARAFSLMTRHARRLSILFAHPRLSDLALATIGHTGGRTLARLVASTRPSTLRG
jgi:flavin-dependent dehydrogenase